MAVAVEVDSPQAPKSSSTSWIQCRLSTARPPFPCHQTQLRQTSGLRGSVAPVRCWIGTRSAYGQGRRTSGPAEPAPTRRPASRTAPLRRARATEAPARSPAPRLPQARQRRALPTPRLRAAGITATAASTMASPGRRPTPCRPRRRRGGDVVAQRSLRGKTETGVELLQSGARRLGLAPPAGRGDVEPWLELASEATRTMSMRSSPRAARSRSAIRARISQPERSGR